MPWQPLQPACWYTWAPRTSGSSITTFLWLVKLPGGVEPIVPKGEDPTVATIVIPKVMTAEEEAAEAAATTVSAADVPTTAQKTKEEEAAEAAAKSAGGKEGANDCNTKGGCSVPLMEGAWETLRKKKEGQWTEKKLPIGQPPPAKKE